MLSEISGEVRVYDLDGADLREVQTIAADSLRGEGSADIHLSPDGRHLYASNRLKADGIVHYTVDSVSGRLTRAGYQLTGVHPRNFAITPNGRWLLVACRDDNVIEIYSRDLTSGELVRQGEIPVSKPTCVQFAPYGRQ